MNPLVTMLAIGAVLVAVGVAASEPEAPPTRAKVEYNGSTYNVDRFSDGRVRFEWVFDGHPSVRITIAPDGTVSDVEVVEGQKASIASLTKMMAKMSTDVFGLARQLGLPVKTGE